MTTSRHVLCSGVFDGLHAGHVAYLHAASALCDGGDELIVAVAPDAYIRLVKHREPHWALEDRMTTVSALAAVDQVLAHGETGVADVIRVLRPRLFVKGADWRLRLARDVVEACRDSQTVIQFVREVPVPHLHEVQS